MTIQFYKINSTAPVVKYLATELNKLLKSGKKVLWLVPGGSGLQIATQVSGLLQNNLSNLTVTLTDERWGPVGHANSNWQQLLNAGFRLDGARLQSPLEGDNLARSAQRYEQLIATDFEQNDYVLALVGIGADGHSLGIKPGSPAIDSKKLVEGYEWKDYNRLTLTPLAIGKMDEVVVFAVGGDKHPILESLDKGIGINQQPAQALKFAKKVIVFNDFIGEDI